ncbi:MAG: hypothetical protein ACO1Q7_04250 [Gemmatimonas sp.]
MSDCVVWRGNPGNGHPAFARVQGSGSRPKGLRGVLRQVVLTAVLTTASAASSAYAQAVTDRIDAGSLSIEQQGHRVGREQFSLRRAPAPDGSEYELRSESVAGDRRVAVQLTTDSAGSPVRYSLEVREGTRVSVRAGGQRTRSRFTTQTIRPGGETVREHLLVPGTLTLVVEADFYHQLALVLRGRPAVTGQSITISAISLLDDVQQRLRLSLESQTDSVTIAGSARPAFRWKLEDEKGVVRLLWGDADGRLLRVSVPSRSIDVTRDALPK